jgi:hypothetical protein
MYGRTIYILQTQPYTAPAPAYTPPPNYFASHQPTSYPGDQEYHSLMFVHVQQMQQVNSNRIDALTDRIRAETHSQYPSRKKGRRGPFRGGRGRGIDWTSGPYVSARRPRRKTRSRLMKRKPSYLRAPEYALREPRTLVLQNFGIPLGNASQIPTQASNVNLTT